MIQIPQVFAGETEPTPDTSWVLNPNTTFPLTILGVDEQTVLELRGLLDPSIHATELYGSVAALVARTGLRCKEIEEYVAQFRETFDGGKEPDVIPYCDWYTLFEGPHLDSSVGRSLVARYGFENLRFYSRHPKMIGAPRPIPATHRDRERFEQLARVGLATIGPPISKGGKSGEPFSLNVLEGSVSTDELASWIGYCRAVAEVLTLTFSHSSYATAGAQSYDAPEIVEILKGYKVTAAGGFGMCRFCGRMDGKKYSPGARPRVPFHIGCRCTLIGLFK